MGTIERHENVLSFSLLDEIHEYIVQNTDGYIWRDNLIWNEDIKAGSAPLMMASLEQFE